MIYCTIQAQLLIYNSHDYNKHSQQSASTLNLHLLIFWKVVLIKTTTLQLWAFFAGKLGLLLLWKMVIKNNALSFILRPSSSIRNGDLVLMAFSCLLLLRSSNINQITFFSSRRLDFQLNIKCSKLKFWLEIERHSFNRLVVNLIQKGLTRNIITSALFLQILSCSFARETIELEKNNSS